MEQKQQKTFVVTLKGAGPWISELHYEKEDQDLRLYFTLKKEVKVNVIVEDEKPQSKEALGSPFPFNLLTKKIVQMVEYKPESDLYISLLSKSDFQQCNATPKALGQALAEVKEFAGEDSSLLLIFEMISAPGSQGLLWSKNAAMRKKMLESYQGKERGNWVLFQGTGLKDLKESAQSLL